MTDPGSTQVVTPEPGRMWPRTFSRRNRPAKDTVKATGDELTVAAPEDPDGAPADRGVKSGLDPSFALMVISVIIGVVVLLAIVRPLLPGNGSGSGRIVVIDVQVIENPYLDLIKKSPQINGPALGTALGTAIHLISADLARRGYIVLNGDNVLAVPASVDVTAIVGVNVAQQLTAQNPGWALNTSNQAPAGNSQTPLAGAPASIPPPSLPNSNAP